MSRWFTEREEALLEERARRLSNLHQEQRETERLVVFRRGEAQYAIAAGDLLGVRQMGRIARLPSVPPHLVGLVHLSGKTVGVLDLARLSVSDATPPAVPWGLWVSRGSKSVMVLADELLDLIDIPSAEFVRDVVGAFSGPLASRTRAILPGPLVVLDGLQLLDSSLFRPLER